MIKNKGERMKNLGQAFKYFRLNKHYSLLDAAKKDISVSQLSRFERGGF